MNKLPLVLKRILAERRLSQRQLSKDSGVSISTLNGMLAGKKAYSVENLLKISEVLSVSLDRLLKDQESDASGVEHASTHVVLDGYYRLRLEKIEVEAKKGSKK